MNGRPRGAISTPRSCHLAPARPARRYGDAGLNPSQLAPEPPPQTDRARHRGFDGFTHTRNCGNALCDGYDGLLEPGTPSPEQPHLVGGWWFSGGSQPVYLGEQLGDLADHAEVLLGIGLGSGALGLFPALVQSPVDGGGE